ncbi:MAG: hypothetical protein IKA70_02645 [Alistipes sp.]|nr:hypothetical protein [Alistipes sp.]
MKTAIYITTMFAFALVSCSELLKETADPEVEVKQTTMVTAEIEPIVFEGLDDVLEHTWSTSDHLGIYGSVKGVNSRYDLLSSTVGEKVGEFYGETIAGEFLAYYPYSKGGYAPLLEYRQTIPAEQVYYASALNHISNNVVFVGMAVEEHFTLTHNVGLLHVSAQLDMKGVETMRFTVRNIEEGYDSNIVGDVAFVDGVEPFMTNASQVVRVSNIGGQNSSEAAPLDIWVVAAPGTYENFVFGFYGTDAEGKEWAVTKPVKGPFVVERAKITDCAVQDINYDYGAGDFDFESGTFN